MNEPTWRKSSFTVDNNCVEIAETGGDILVRNSNHPDRGTLALPRQDFADWLAGCKAGEFDDLV